jgi:hypothetical protein
MEAIRLKARVEADGGIRLPRLQLPAGEEVEVILLHGADRTSTEGSDGEAGLSAFYGRGRGLGFSCADEADRFLREERDGWQR